jgi:hypothetical protein
MVTTNNEIDGNKKYTSNADDFDCHADAVVRCRVHCLMKHIPGFTRRQWMLPLGKCLCRITPAVAMVDKFAETTQNTNKAQLLASNYSTFPLLVVYENSATQLRPSTQLIDATSFV